LSKLLESSQKANEAAAGGGGALSGTRALGPGDIGPSKAECAPASEPKAATKEIWGDDDVKEGDLFTTHIDSSDKRPEPAHKVPDSPHSPTFYIIQYLEVQFSAIQVVYSQSVGSSDVFLGMSGKFYLSFPVCATGSTWLTASPGKDPSTMSCDRLTVCAPPPFRHACRKLNSVAFFIVTCFCPHVLRSV
jgi:hypothetical protein